MSIREKLADWLTGGALSEAIWSAQASHAIAQRRKAALDAIIAMETPSCAPVGKRMAKRAREGRQ